jgi:hypothetical protein
MLLKFITQLFEEANIRPTTENLRATMLQETFTRLQQNILLDLLGALPDDRLEDFKKIAEETPDQEHIMNFLKVAVPNSTELIGESLLDFKNAFLNAPIVSE